MFCCFEAVLEARDVTRSRKMTAHKNYAMYYRQNLRIGTYGCQVCLRLALDNATRVLK